MVVIHDGPKCSMCRLSSSFREYLALLVFPVTMKVSKLLFWNHLVKCWNVTNGLTKCPKFLIFFSFCFFPIVYVIFQVFVPCLFSFFNSNFLSIILSAQKNAPSVNSSSSASLAWSSYTTLTSTFLFFFCRDLPWINLLRAVFTMVAFPNTLPFAEMHSYGISFHGSWLFSSLSDSSEKSFLLIVSVWWLLWYFFLATGWCPQIHTTSLKNKRFSSTPSNKL